LKNPLKAKVKAGKTVIGMVNGINHPDVPEILARMGIDFMLWDTEHSPMEVETVQQLMIAASSNPECVPIIRVGWNDMVRIKKALDTNAYGLIIPWVNSREEAENAVRYCMYPPKGIRGCGPRRPLLYDFEYIQTVNDELLIIVQCETQMALDNLDEILSVEGIDVCMIGPGDLSFSLGIHGQFDHPKFNEALDHVLAMCKKHDVAPGFFCTDENINDMIARGFRFFNLAGDFWFLMRGVIEALAEVNGWEPTPFNR